MRIAGTIQDSIVDGPGYRFVVFTQGCDLYCEGCHNPATWEIDAGTDAAVVDIISEMLSNPLTDGLTLSGGEPFLQARDCAALARTAKEHGLNVWAFTGKTFEELLSQSDTSPEFWELLHLLDVLVDGPFVLSQRSMSLKWRGSKNQRVLDVPKSLEIRAPVILSGF